MKNDKGVGQKMTGNGRKMNLAIVTTRLGESVFSGIFYNKNNQLCVFLLIVCLFFLPDLAFLGHPLGQGYWIPYPRRVTF